ncbi:TetR/AcrR family transcriptional regulator [Actinophytocola oryzae]|uniref:TetR family transcriptional regulator n=1 Tax=Actinophytocola oryzae TaxID=502181 RepID=A0A4R7VBA5_9PSEU|nr:TetR family transcriptional regulator [Actinophytocola oryzae]
MVYAGQGDQRRVMELLWRAEREESPKPGPKPALTVELIVAAAIDIADERGMSALSMRAVGQRVGRTGMALYTYVPSKMEIIDLMYDTVIAETHRAYDLGNGWRAALTEWAEDMWAFYLRHPWVLSVSQARPVLGPNEYVLLDTVFGIMFETGLEPVEVRRLTGALFQLVRGVTQVVAEAKDAAASTGTSDDEWWHARAPLLTEMAPDFAERFPMVTKLAGADAFAMDDETQSYLEQSTKESFRSGLRTFFDGIEASVARKT